MTLPMCSSWTRDGVLPLPEIVPKQSLSIHVAYGYLYTIPHTATLHTPLIPSQSSPNPARCGVAPVPCMPANRPPRPGPSPPPPPQPPPPVTSSFHLLLPLPPPTLRGGRERHRGGWRDGAGQGHACQHESHAPRPWM
jgi:hypothetical protein